MITEDGLIVNGGRLIRIDDYLVIDGPGRAVDYHSRVTFEVLSETADAEYVYQSGYFRSGPTTHGRATVRGISHTEGLSRVGIGFEPPIKAGDTAEISIEAFLGHEVPLTRIFRFSGERGLDGIKLDAFFWDDHLPEQVWQVQLAIKDGKPTDRVEQPVELTRADKNDPDDNDHRASLELNHVPPHMAVGLRWEW